MQSEYPLFARSEVKEDPGIVTMLHSEIIHLKEERDKLKEQVIWLRRQLFGSKSEVLREEPKQGDIDLGPEAKGKPKPEPDSEKPQKEQKRAPKEKSYTVLPLKTVHIDLIPDEVKAHPELYRRIEEKTPRTCVRSEIIPAHIVRTVYTLAAYVRKDDPDATPIRAKAPANLLRGSELGNSVPAQVTYNKYILHLPLYRQRKEMWRIGIRGLEENTVCHWIKLTADELEPLYRLKHDDLLKEAVLHADETSFRCQKRDKTDTHIWAIAPVRGGALYLWGANRSADNLDRLLRQGMRESGPSYSGTIVTDGWASYGAWIKKRAEEHKAAPGDPRHPAAPRHQACWTHARREFVEGSQGSQDPKWCREIVELIAPLYKMENELRESNAPPDAILERRQREALPQVNEIFRRIKERMQIAPRPVNKLKDAIGYALNREAELRLYLGDPAVPMDNNTIERAMRPLKLGLKNYLFAGSEEGAKRACIIYTMMEECNHAGVDPLAWLNAVLGKVRTWQGDLHDLMPGRLAFD